MAASSNSQEGDFGFQIAPMVDVVFVLLLFFMAIASLRQVENQIKGSLASKTSGDFDPPIIFDIAADGKVTANGTALLDAGERDGAALDAWLKGHAGAAAETPFVVRADGNTVHERFMQVMAALQRAGARKVSMM